MTTEEGPGTEAQTSSPLVCHECWGKQTNWYNPCPHAMQIWQQGYEQGHKNALEGAERAPQYEVTPQHMESMEEIARLANFLSEYLPHEISRSENAVDIVIRLLRPLVQSDRREGEERKGLRERIDSAVGNYCGHDGEPTADGDCPTCLKIVDDVMKALAADRREGEQGPLMGCGHPVQCLGMDAEDKGCGWCGDNKDMKVLIDHLSRTYDHFSGGRISKPLTLPEEVFDVANELENERIAEMVDEELNARREQAAPGLQERLRQHVPCGEPIACAMCSCGWKPYLSSAAPDIETQWAIHTHGKLDLVNGPHDEGLTFDVDDAPFADRQETPRPTIRCEIREGNTRYFRGDGVELFPERINSGTILLRAAAPDMPSEGK